MEKFIRLILVNAFILKILKKIVYKHKKILLLNKIKLLNYQNHRQLILIYLKSFNKKLRNKKFKGNNRNNYINFNKKKNRIMEIVMILIRD